MGFLLKAFTKIWSLNNKISKNIHKIQLNYHKFILNLIMIKNMNKFLLAYKKLLLIR